MTGSLLAPQGIGSLLPRLVTGKLTDRISSCPIILLGLLITALDTLPFAWATRSTIQIIQQVGGSFGTAILIILLTRAFFTLTPQSSI
jgi:MFS family permease